MRNLGANSLTNFSSDNNTVTIRKAVEKYQNYASIKVIRENIDFTNNFSFNLDKILNAQVKSNNFDTSKATLIF